MSCHGGRCVAQCVISDLKENKNTYRKLLSKAAQLIVRDKTDLTSKKIKIIQTTHTDYWRDASVLCICLAASGRNSETQHYYQGSHNQKQKKIAFLIRKGLEGGTSATDKTQSVYEGVIKTTPLLTCSITSRHSESESAQMETTMSQSCYCLWKEE